MAIQISAELWDWHRACKPVANVDIRTKCLAEPVKLEHRCGPLIARHPLHHHGDQSLPSRLDTASTFNQLRSKTNLVWAARFWFEGPFARSARAPLLVDPLQ